MNFGRFSFVIALFLLPLSTQAATLYLDPVSVKSGPDDVFEVKVKIGTGLGECVNAGNISLTFPPEVLEAKDFNSGESIFSLWVNKPGRDDMDKINADGRIVFSGGLPGGYCGKISGDPGDSNILGSVIFSPKKPISFSKGGIDFDIDTEVYLNDGQGTKASLETQGANVEIDKKAVGQRDDWKQKIVEDIFPPEPFLIQISRDSKVADGRYFIVFSTTDKQTGVDHYEVLEAKPSQVAGYSDKGLFGFLKKMFGVKSPTVDFKIVDSPYVLQDQALKSVIKVKAVDLAGNERLVEYQNEALDDVIKRQNRPPVWPLAAGAAILFSIVALAWSLAARMRRK